MVDRQWEVEVVPLVVGQRSVKEKEWLETLKIFGIMQEDVKRIIGRLGYTQLNEDENLFGSYWRHTFGTSRCLNSESVTNIVNTGIHTPATYFGNLIEQKKNSVRLMEDMMSSECQSTKTA